MKKLNWGLIACGVIGAIMVVALPIITAPMTLKLFDIPGGHGGIVLGALLVGAAMGAMNLFQRPARWTAILATVAFAIVGMKLSGSEPGIEVGPGATGGMILGFVGMLLGIALAIKPGKAA